MNSTFFIATSVVANRWNSQLFRLIAPSYSRQKTHSTCRPTADSRFKCCLRFGYRSTRASFFVVVVLLGACQQEKAKPLNVAVGQAFPALKVQDMQGNKHLLRFVGDKVTVLNIWATWCGPCRHEMPSLQRLSDILDGKKYQVIGISVDDDSHIAQEYLIDKKIKFTNYIDPSMDVANVTLGMRAYPSTFVINEKGVLMLVEEKWRYWDEVGILARIRAFTK